MKKAIEGYLSGYKSMVARANALAIKEGVQEFSLKAQHYENVGSSPNVTPSEIDRYVVMKMSKIEEGLSEELDNLLKEINIINEALKTLDDKQEQFVIDRYFEGKTFEDISFDWGVARTTVYRWRDKIVYKLYHAGMDLLLQR